MAIYGFDVKTISRGRGESAAKTVSYILRENVYDPYLRKTHYYSYKKDIMYSEIMIPECAPEEYHDLKILVREMEKAERRYDARIGRVMRLTLPNDKDISNEERIRLVRKFVETRIVKTGMCAVIAIHEGKNNDPAKENPHAHIMVTDRPVDSEGFCKKKNRDWNRNTALLEWRKAWAEIQNEFFRTRGLGLEVSHESLKVQGIKREPTIPLGRAAMALEKKGIRTVNGDKNRDIYKRQRELQEELERSRQRSREMCRGR